MRGTGPSKRVCGGLCSFFFNIPALQRSGFLLSTSIRFEIHTPRSRAFIRFYTISTARTPKYPHLGSLIGALVPDVSGVYEPGGVSPDVWAGFGPYPFVEGPMVLDTVALEMTEFPTSLEPGPELYPVIHCFPCFG